MEQLPPATGGLREIAARIMAASEQDPRLQPLGNRGIEAVGLSDSTEAVFLASVFVKEGQRQSLQLKLIARDSESRIWMVSAFLVGGKGSRWCTVGSELETWLRTHVLSLTFTPGTVDENRLRDAYRRRGEQ